MTHLISLSVMLFLLVDPLAQATTIPDLPPDATTEQLLREHARLKIKPSAIPLNAIDEMRRAGERNLEWLKYINSFRPKNPISLSSPETQRGFPMHAPAEYSPTIIADKMRRLKAELPPTMASVVFDGGAFTKEPPVELEKFIEWGCEIDRQYQTALRWQMMAPRLGELAGRRRRDVRGVYFFSRLPQAERTEILTSPGLWNPEERARYRDWLIGMCLNNDKTNAECVNIIDQRINTRQSLLSLYQGWRSASQRLYNSFFSIPSYARRSDVTFRNPNLTTIPFQTPSTRAVLNYVRDNVEDEWRSGAWNLKLQFLTSASVHIVFESGATPHVNGLGGDRITMNADQPLTEYDAQWTIRHEFGHVLGLPDCYVEFYDTNRRVMIAYQIDIENLMCSRRGRIQDTHVRELRRVYSNHLF